MSDDATDDGSGSILLPSGAVIEAHLLSVDVDSRWLTLADRNALARYMSKKWFIWATGDENV